jgi:uncharacterized protein (UPF0147 family)
MKKIIPILLLAIVAGCGSAGTAEKLLNDIDAARASIAHDRNQLLVDLLHDKAVYAVRDATNQAKLTLLATARDGTVTMAAAFAELDKMATEVNLTANTRAINRGQVEMLNVAEERADALELGLRIQIEAAKGIFGRVMEAVEAWQAKRATAKPPTESFPSTQPVALEALK